LHLVVVNLVVRQQREDDRGPALWCPPRVLGGLGSGTCEVHPRFGLCPRRFGARLRAGPQLCSRRSAQDRRPRPLSTEPVSGAI